LCSGHVRLGLLRLSDIVPPNSSDSSPARSETRASDAGRDAADSGPVSRGNKFIRFIRGPGNGSLGPAHLAALAAGISGLLVVARYIPIFAKRLSFPLDLEWMEGGTLLHALRLVQGKGIYVEPSVEFIPFLYTPGYPAALAWLSETVPGLSLSYALGRGVSLTAFALALCAVVWTAWRETRSQGRDEAESRRQKDSRPGPAPRTGGVWGWCVGLGAAGVVVGGFGFTGTFYDLVRADSSLLALEAAALTLAVAGRGLPSAALAGLLVAFGFFTKQTASILGLSLGLGLLWANPRRGVVYGLVAAATLAAGFVYGQAQSQGWFWRYIFEMHQSHPFNRELAFAITPQRLLRALWPLYAALAVLLVVLIASRRLARRDAPLVLCALGGIAAACIGFGTQWAFENAFIPAVFFPSWATAVFAARLLCDVAADPGAATPAVGAGLLRRVRSRLGAVGRSPWLLTGVPVLMAVQLWLWPAPAVRAWVPREVDRVAGERFLEILGTLPGDGFVPFHPYYNVLVGKAPHVHRMGVLDVRASYGRPRGLDSAIRKQSFPFVILDWKSVRGEWPGLNAAYHPAHTFMEGIDSVRMFSGAQTAPRTLYLPTRTVQDVPIGGVVLSNFEAGRWAFFGAEGAAFGPAPAGTHSVGTGRFAATSGHGGDAATGGLRSKPFALQAGTLRFTWAGSDVPGTERSGTLSALLIVDEEVVARAEAPQSGGRPSEFQLALTPLAEQQARAQQALQTNRPAPAMQKEPVVEEPVAELVFEDNSSSSHLVVDDIHIDP